MKKYTVIIPGKILMQFNTFADAASAANHATSYIIINNETGAIKENIGQKL